VRGCTKVPVAFVVVIADALKVLQVGPRPTRARMYHRWFFSCVPTGSFAILGSVRVLATLQAQRVGQERKKQRCEQKEGENTSSRTRTRVILPEAK
jgi:hypothetical protein